MVHCVTVLHTPPSQTQPQHSTVCSAHSSFPDTATTQHSLFMLAHRYLLAEHPSALSYVIRCSFNNTTVQQYNSTTIQQYNNTTVPTIQQYQQCEVVFSVAELSVLSRTYRCCSLSLSLHTQTHTHAHARSTLCEVLNKIQDFDRG